MTCRSKQAAPLSVLGGTIRPGQVEPRITPVLALVLAGHRVRKHIAGVTRSHPSTESGRLRPRILPRLMGNGGYFRRPARAPFREATQPRVSKRSQEPAAAEWGGHVTPTTSRWTPPRSRSSSTAEPNPPCKAFSSTVIRNPVRHASSMSRSRSNGLTKRASTTAREIPSCSRDSAACMAVVTPTPMAMIEPSLPSRSFSPLPTGTDRTFSGCANPSPLPRGYR